MASNHCDNCDRDKPRETMVPFVFMGGTGLRCEVPCEMAESVKELSRTYNLTTGRRKRIEALDMPEELNR